MIRFPTISGALRTKLTLLCYAILLKRWDTRNDMSFANVLEGGSSRLFDFESQHLLLMQHSKNYLVPK